MLASLSFFRRHLIGHAALLLFVGWLAVAQEPSDDRSKTAPRAGVNGVSVPTCEYCPAPEYSQEARKKKYEGVVVLMVVVTSEGKATNINIIKSPGLGLDQEAVDAVRKWRFKPAMKSGKPVDAQLPIEITFHL